MKSLFVDRVNPSKYFIAEYSIETNKSLYDAALNIAIGQSIGNPTIRSVLETEELIEEYGCKILIKDEYYEKTLKASQKGNLTIAFPLNNIDLKTDGITQLLCFLMGGHLDIDIITSCKLQDIQFPTTDFVFNKNNGIQRLRNITDVHDKPLLGGIIKPKTGISPNQLLDIVKQLVDGGVNFIKEDEILGNPTICSFDKRLNLIQPYIDSTKVVYCYCINSDPHIALGKCRNINTFNIKSDKKGVHLNIHAGLGLYNSIRRIYPDFFIHFQKSGDKLYTYKEHNYSVTFNTLCKLVGMMGMDSMHIGMWYGYSSDAINNLQDLMITLYSYSVMPTLSCGIHPGMIDLTTQLLGIDYIANVGGAIHGHPDGILAGALAMRQAIDRDYQKEYYKAVDTWGVVNKWHDVIKHH